jgi:nucleoside-diphosphate kinase
MQRLPSYPQPANGAPIINPPHILEHIMAVTRTFSIIKPDATRRNLTGAVTAMLEGAGLRVVASKRIHMSREQAEGFYAVHKERPFFGELCDFMMSEPVVVQVLEGDDAVTRNRDTMGATNPADAAEGTIRKTHALSIGENTVHGSDSDENAAIEIAFFFKPEEIVG